MTERQQLIAQKRRLAAAKNMLKQTLGIDVLQLYEQDENIPLNQMYDAYIHSTYSYNSHILPYSRLHYQAPASLVYSWIAQTMKLQENHPYFLYCGLWAKIIITDVPLMVKSLWEESAHSGFLLAEGDLSRMLEAGFDSRDEEHFLIDIWEYPLKKQQKSL